MSLFFFVEACEKVTISMLKNWKKFAEDFAKNFNKTPLILFMLVAAYLFMAIFHC